MKTNEIADAIINSMVERSFYAFGTSIEGAGIHEADVLGITRTGYIYEYEIKVSRSDFKADFNKKHKHLNLHNRTALKVYDTYENGKKTGEQTTLIKIPNRFYFACIEGLIKSEDIPDYAGLIWINKFKTITVIKNAPLLHRNKANIHLYKRIANILSQRMIYGCSYYTYLQKKKNNE